MPIAISLVWGALAFALWNRTIPMYPQEFDNEAKVFYKIYYTTCQLSYVTGQEMFATNNRRRGRWQMSHEASRNQSPICCQHSHCRFGPSSPWWGVSYLTIMLTHMWRYTPLPGHLKRIPTSSHCGFGFRGLGVFLSGHFSVLPPIEEPASQCVHWRN